MPELRRMKQKGYPVLQSELQAHLGDVVMLSLKVKEEQKLLKVLFCFTHVLHKLE